MNHLHSPWSWARYAAILLGWLGILNFLRHACFDPTQHNWILFILLGVPTAALTVGLIHLAGKDPHDTTRGLAAFAWRIESGARRCWPAFLVLAGLPVAEMVPPLIGHPVYTLTVIAAMLFASGSDGTLLGAGARRGLAVGQPRPGLRPWDWGLLAVAVTVACMFVIIAWAAVGNHTADAAYYFGVARHIAVSGRFEEPIIWQFLAAPDTIIHTPFDYWSGVTSMFLVPVLKVFGATHHVAFVTMGVLSGITVLAFWYLVTVAFPLRHPMVQLAALLYFAFSPALAYYRFDTETIPLMHLFMIGALVALAHGRLILTVVAAFMLFLTRGDGLIPCVVLWGGALLAAQKSNDSGKAWRNPRLGRLLLTQLALIIAYVVYNFVLFGTPTPPATRLAPFLEHIGQLLVYDVPVEPSAAKLLARLAPDQWAQSVGTIFGTLREVSFVPAQGLWFGLGLLALARLRRGEGFPFMITLLALFLLAPILITLASGVVYSDRALGVLIPVFVLVGAIGLEEALYYVAAIVRTGTDAFYRRALAALITLVIGWVLFGHVRVYGLERRHGVDPEFAILQDTFKGEAVATDLPYWVVAYTGSPAVAIPVNGEQAISQVLGRYEPSWLLLSPDPWPEVVWRDAPTAELLRQIYQGSRTRVGLHTLEPAVEWQGLRAFRVHPPAQIE